MSSCKYEEHDNDNTSGIRNIKYQIAKNEKNRIFISILVIPI